MLPEAAYKPTLSRQMAYYEVLRFCHAKVFCIELRVILKGIKASTSQSCRKKEEEEKIALLASYVKFQR